MDYKHHLSNGITESDFKGPHLPKSSVNIHSIIMPSGPHRIWISLRACKCRLFCCGIIVFVLMLFILSNIVSFSRTPQDLSLIDKVCKVNEIELQEDVDFEQFQGSWYATYTKGMENKLLAYFLEFYDVKTKFILREDGNFDLRSVGGKFMGYWCPIGEGHAEARDPNLPEKLSMFFDTPTGKKFGTKPAWILKTDYTSYSIMYSCWEETADGSCKQGNTYIVVLQRSTDKLPADKKQEVDQAIRDTCIDPKVLRPIHHYGYCSKERENL